MLIGYHASHEQFPPEQLLHWCRQAAQAGFDALSSSDHFHPWTRTQGHSGHAWTWLGAAMQATGLPAGVITVPGYRYNPTVLAQAASTLARMHADRFWLAAGSGELLNEGIVGGAWPIKQFRNERLVECVEIMRKLWAGQTVTHHGHVVVEEATLFSRPHQPPRVLAAAMSNETAQWAGQWADGLITTSRPPEEMRQIIDAFNRGGGRGKPVAVKVGLSYAPSQQQALDDAWQQWRELSCGSEVLAELRRPEQFEAIGRTVEREHVSQFLRVSADLDQHVEWLRRDVELGVTELYLHNVSPRQEQFIEDFSRHVLPALRG